MQKYRFFPTCRYLFLHKDFLSSVLAMDKEDSNELLPNLLPPQHFQKHEQGSLWSLSTACKGDYAACMAIIQESLQTEMLEECLASFTSADCVFLLLPCVTAHTLPALVSFQLMIQERKTVPVLQDNPLNQRNMVLSTVYTAHLWLVYRDF